MRCISQTIWWSHSPVPFHTVKCFNGCTYRGSGNCHNVTFSARSVNTGALHSYQHVGINIYIYIYSFRVFCTSYFPYYPFRWNPIKACKMSPLCHFWRGAECQFLPLHSFRIAVTVFNGLQHLENLWHKAFGMCTTVINLIHRCTLLFLENTFGTLHVCYLHTSCNNVGEILQLRKLS